MNSEDRALLEAFVVENQDLEELEAVLAEFNVFEAMGTVHQELRHSDFLAFLLDPAQNHGLGDIFLKKFLKRVLIDADEPPVSAIEVDVANLEETSIQRERRHIDILIYNSEHNLVCVIENKIRSREHSGQLQRYREQVTNEFAEYRPIFIYLTPGGNKPSDDSYIPFSYVKVAKLVDDVRQAYESILGTEVFTLMTHYTKMLRRNIVSDSEIAELCRKIYHQHSQALNLIFAHYPDLRSYVGVTVKRLVMDTEDLILDEESSPKYIDFYDKEWNSLFSKLLENGWNQDELPTVYFEFENYSKELWLSLCVDRTSGSPLLHQTINKFALQHSDVFRETDEDPDYFLLDTYQLLSPQDYEGCNADGVAKKLQAQWDRYITQDLLAIRRLQPR